MESEKKKNVIKGENIFFKIIINHVTKKLSHPKKFIFSKKRTKKFLDTPFGIDDPAPI